MHWGLRLLENQQIIGEEDFLKDQFFVYDGMYGIPKFCIWWMAPDKTFKIYQGMAFKLFFFKGARDIYFAEDFIVQSATYDSTKNLFKIYAIGTSYQDLKTTDYITARVLNTKKDSPVSGQKVLKDMFLNAFPYIDAWFHPGLVDKIGYFAISFDTDFSCLDLLSKICSENNWEWYLRTDAIFIRQCLQFKDSYISFSAVENETSKSIDFLNYKYMEVEASAAAPGALYGTDYRVIWVTFNMGGEIGGSMGVMLERNRETQLSEDSYLDTVMGIPEHLIYERRGKSYRQNQVIAGRIFGKYSTDNIGAYETPTFSGDVRKFSKWLRKREFKKDYVGDEKPLLWNKNVIMSTPFAGDGVGVQYPQVESHRILLSPAGDREEPVVGNAFYGFKDNVPKRSSEKDFRMQFPSNGMVYYKESDGSYTVAVNKILLTIGQAPHDDYETPNEAALYISDGEATLFGNGWNAKINLKTSEITISGGVIKIDGGSVDINGATFIKGGIVNCKVLTTSGGVVPPNIV